MNDPGMATRRFAAVPDSHLADSFGDGKVGALVREIQVQTYEQIAVQKRACRLQRFRQMGGATGNKAQPGKQWEVAHRILQLRDKTLLDQTVCIDDVD
jgi:hypothetical protein